MKYITGTSRQQLYLFTETIDNIIEEDNQVRFIDAYVDKLDLMELGFVKLNKTKGAPGYNPALLLKIYIYSYLNKIRSSRKIEKECQRNIELIWLTQQLAPDHWVISNFRKVNKKVLTSLFKEFLRFCYKLNLLSFECIDIDGTKMRGQNSVSNVYKRENMDDLIKRNEEKVQYYLNELEHNDEKEKNDYEFLNKDIPEKLKQLRKHKDKLEIIKTIFEDNPELKRYFANDPESNFQKDNGRCIAGFNGQSAVDNKNKLIVVPDVTSENNDLHQLDNIVEQVKTIKIELEKEETEKNDSKMVIVADSGYHCESEVTKVSKDENIDLYTPHPQDVNKKKKENKKKKTTKKLPCEGFKVDDFKYDEEANTFICPEGKKLTFRKEGDRKTQGVKKLVFQCKDCDKCSKKTLCTTNKKGRTITIGSGYFEMKAFRKKNASHLGKKIIAKRKELVEHPFGTIKRTMGFRYFLQKGLENVKAEFSFIAFIYNLKRVFNIVGVNKMIEALN